MSCEPGKGRPSEFASCVYACVSLSMCAFVGCRGGTVSVCQYVINVGICQCVLV